MNNYVICPFSKPGFAEKLRANLARQTFQGFTPIVVENGPAVGSYGEDGRTVILRSDAHQSLAKNAALAWIRERGGGTWSVFDCDDYYAAGYLEDQMKALEGEAELAGKAFGSLMYIRFDDGLYLDGMKGSPSYSKFLNGGAMSCRTADVQDFPVVPIGEDGEWHREMREAGMKSVNTGARFYCYNREGTDHTWGLEKGAEEGYKRRMAALGDLPESSCERPPRSMLDTDGQSVSRVVMLHTPDYAPASVAVPDMREYCRLWGYDLDHYGDLVEPKWPASWNKIPTLLSAMDGSKEGDWVLWMDCDMLMTRVELPLERLTRADKDFMFSVDGNGICLGFFFIRNVPMARKFLNDLFQEWCPHWPWEQNSAKSLIYRDQELAARVGHISESMVQNPVSRPSRHSMVKHYWGNSKDRAALVERMKKDVAGRESMVRRGGRPWMRRL